MAFYKTYQEAVIANGETQGVCTTGDDWAGSERCRGYFTIMDAHETIDVSAGAWIECNPADYLESISDFHARGLELTDGDKYTGLIGQVYTVGEQLSKRAIINRNQDNDQRYVVKAAAYDTETPEEKEALDAMVNTAPQQFDWRNGDHCIFGAGDRSGIYVTYDAYNEGHVIYSGGEYHYVLDGNFRKPETPEQRAERESMERKAEIERMLSTSIKFNNTDLPKTIARIIDDAGYRKQ